MGHNLEKNQEVEEQKITEENKEIVEKYAELHCTRCDYTNKDKIGTRVKNDSSNSTKDNTETDKNPKKEKRKNYKNDNNQNKKKEHNFSGSKGTVVDNNAQGGIILTDNEDEDKDDISEANSSDKQNTKKSSEKEKKSDNKNDNSEISYDSQKREHTVKSEEGVVLLDDGEIDGDVYIISCNSCNSVREETNPSRRTGDYCTKCGGHVEVEVKNRNMNAKENDKD